MRLKYTANNNPRVIIIQKLYSVLYNNDDKLEFPKHRFKKFIKDIVLGTIERNEIIIEDKKQVNQEIKKFDIIQSSGVLHHMNKPIEGLKVLLDILQPHGFLRLGLYSEIARQNVIEARQLIKNLNFKNNIEDIKKFRQFILNDSKNKSLQKLTEGLDFYSTSTTRDLLFHVQEHLYTLPEISKILKNFNLEFLGFVNSSIKNKYSKFFDKDTKNTSLDNWNKFEMSNQETFSNMYQFWVRKNKV